MTEEVQRPVKPLMDGSISIWFHDGTDKSRKHLFGDPRFVGYQEQSWGLQLNFSTHRETIMWHRIHSFDVIYNSPGYMELMDQWAELDHPNHLEYESGCSMCQEVRQSNAAIIAFGGM